MPRRNPTSAQKDPKEEATTVPTTPKATQRKPKTRIVEVEVDPAFVKGRRPSDEQFQQRQDTAYRLRLLGKTPEQIGEIMGLSTRSVREYIQKARERQIDELKRLDGKAGVLRQFAVLNYVLEETLDAWDRSKRVKKIKTAGVETKGATIDGTPVGGDRSITTKKQTSAREEEVIGDASYLDRAMKASKEIRELLGLDAPEVKRLLVANDPVVGNLDNEDLRTLPTEELLRRYRAAAGIGADLG